MNTVVTRMDANDEIFKRILDDADFRDLVADYYVRRVYDRLRTDEPGEGIVELQTT